jgi:transmembrane sensor
VRFEFTAKQRLVQLSRGEAMFTVTSDPQRPFYVNAGLVGVRAIGTQFSVSREDRMVLVTVAQGKVAVMRGDRARANADDQGSAADAGEEAVEAGKQYEATLRGFVGVHDVNVARELAWVQKMLIFSDGNVAQAVHEFNRRNRLQIEVTDPYIAARPVFGRFRANDPESFVKFLAKPLRLKIVRQGMDRVLLESTPQTPSG